MAFFEIILPLICVSYIRDTKNDNRRTWWKRYPLFLYFGENPNLIGIFYTLIRGQVGYEAIIEDLWNELNRLTFDQNIYVFKSFTNNYVVITRAVAANALEKLSKSKNTYPKITEEFLKG